MHISKGGTRIRYIYRFSQGLLLNFLVLFDHNSKREFSLGECFVSFCFSMIPLPAPGLKFDFIWHLSQLGICSGNGKLTFHL